jgi:hypothetical protein
MAIKPDQFYASNLVSHDKQPQWKVKRFPFVGDITKQLAGFLVKFNATLDSVAPALAADDAVLGGIIIDLPDPGETSQTVAVALEGSFNENQIHYGDQVGVTPYAALSPAAITRLRAIGIYLDPAVPASGFAP